MVYPDSYRVKMAADSIKDAFAARMTDFMQKMNSDISSHLVASRAECEFCELTRGDCPDRLDAGMA